MRVTSRIAFVSVSLITCLFFPGCSKSDEIATVKTEQLDNTVTLPVSKDQVEILNWWVGAGDEKGYKALVLLLKDKYPDISIHSVAVEGAGGSNAKIILNRRMNNNDPPDSFQASSSNIRAWAEKGKLVPINELYKQEGWIKKFPQIIIDQLRVGDDIYAVPLNIHRENVLWYNKQIFAALNIKPPTTLDELLQVSAVLDNKGIIPFAIGTKDSTMEHSLLKNTLVAILGYDKFLKVTSGEMEATRKELDLIFEYVVQLMNYTNADHKNMTWSDAAQLFAKGKTAMIATADWAKGNFEMLQSSLSEEDYGWLEFPGTEGTFLAMMDTFGMPKDASNPEATKKWLQLIGSVEAQDAFNPLKGSIPARIDADPKQYDAYGRETMLDFQNSLKESQVSFNSVGRGISELYNEFKNE